MGQRAPPGFSNDTHFLQGLHDIDPLPLSLSPSHSPFQNVWRKWSSFNIGNWISLNSKVILPQSFYRCRCSHSSSLLHETNTNCRDQQLTINLTDLSKKLTVHQRQREVLLFAFSNTQKSDCPTQLPSCTYACQQIFTWRHVATWKSRWAIESVRHSWVILHDFLCYGLYPVRRSTSSTFFY